MIIGHDCFPDDYKYEDEEQNFMKIWSQNMSVALHPLSSSSDTNRKVGAFSAACYIHGEFSHSQPLIHGISYIEAFSNFYFSNGDDDDGASFQLYDDCGVMCNPTCPKDV